MSRVIPPKKSDSMEFEKALEDIRNGKPILVYDFDDRERECDLTVASQFVTFETLRMMRKDAGGLVCTTLPYGKAMELGLPFMSDVFWDDVEKYPLLKAMAPTDIPYDRTKSSFGITINHRDTYTGITDKDRALTISEFAKREIVDHLGIDPEKIDVIYMGCHKRFTERVTAEQCEGVRNKYKLPANYVLSVGTITNNSNIDLVIRALSKSEMPIDLVIAGRASAYIDRVNKLIAKFNMTSRVHILHGVAAEDMPAIYSNAIAYLSTSRYDGFNYHIVEALNVGTAVIATSGTSHEEAAGPDAIYVDTDNSAEIRAAIESVAANRPMRESMIAKGKVYAQRFRPEVIAYNTLKCYNRVGIEIEG